MITTAAALRQHHRELQTRVNELRALGDSLDNRDDGDLLAALVPALRFLRYDLLPYARAEEAELYPVVALLLGAPQGTATMSREHLEIILMTGDLGRWRDALERRKPGARTQIRRLLYALHAVLMLHFAKEEEIYLPLIEHAVDVQGGTELFEALRRTAESFRSNAVRTDRGVVSATR